MASEQFSLCWDNFHKNMSSGMNALLEHEDFVDVTLAVEGKYLKAHKMVLSVCSPYFKELFKTNPCPHPIVFMKDYSYVALSDLIQFMYQGEVQVSQENLTTFIKTAEALQIKGLTGDGNGSTENEIDHEKSVQQLVDDYKPSPTMTRPKKLATSTPASSAPKRQRLSTSTSEVLMPANVVTKTEPVSNTSTSDVVQFKMEPYDQSQTISIQDDDDQFGAENLDETAGDDTEDYSMMEGNEEEPQAGTSAEGSGEGQEHKTKKSLNGERGQQQKCDEKSISKQSAKKAIVELPKLIPRIEIDNPKLLEALEDTCQSTLSSGEENCKLETEIWISDDSCNELDLFGDASDFDDTTYLKICAAPKCEHEIFSSCHLCSKFLCHKHFEIYGDSCETHSPAKKKRRSCKGTPNAGRKSCVSGVVSTEEMRGRCDTEKCVKRGFDCYLFDETCRNEIFTNFFNLRDPTLQRDFIARHIEVTATQQKNNREQSRRRKTNRYFLTLSDYRHQICKTLFLNTLGISEKAMRTAVEKHYNIYHIAHPENENKQTATVTEIS